MRSSSLTRGFFFNHAAAGVRRCSFTRGFFFFLLLSVTWPRPPLGEILVRRINHETCNVSSPKAFKTLIHENVTHIIFFIVCKIYIFLVLLRCSIRKTTTCQNMQGLRHW